MSNDYNGKKRSELPDSVFGIPQERKYPMPDEKHTRSAIKLFNHVDPKYEEQLAKAVIKNMKKYGIDGSVVGPNNRLRKYLPKDMIKESANRPLIYTWERANIPEYSVIQESSHRSDFSYSGIKTSAEKSEFKRNFREVFKEDPTESSVNYMQMIKYKGDLVGYIGFSRYKEGKKKYLGIGNFMILKRYQRSGMGSKVISDIIDRYKDNYDEIYCYVDKDNTNAIAFYKKIAKVNTDNLTKYGYYVTLYSKSIGESAMLEGYLKSDKDIYYNKDKFDSGEINLCFITGLSGSGKSTMGRNMSSKNIEHYEMDDVICNDNFSDGNLKEYGGLISSFFKGAGKSFRLIQDDDKHNDSVFNTHKNYEKEITQAFVKHAISYCKSHKGIKYVCDGIWIFMFIKPEQLKDCAVYIKGTSSIKSGYRALKRDIDEDKRNGMTSLQIFKHEFKRVKEDILYAWENQKELKSFRSYFEKQSTNESYVEEGYFRSTDNLEFNLDKWSKSGNHNLLYITGISGSGKTTLAKEMCKKYKAEYIELDKFTLGIVKGLDRWFENVNNGTYEVHPLLKEYFSQLDYLTTNGSWSKPDMGNEHDKFLTWLIKKVKGNGTLYIVEGAQFFMKLSNMDPNLIKGEPLIVVGTSAFKSWIRRIKRDTANDETISRFIYHLKKDIPMLFKYYFSNEKDLQKYIKNMQSNINESSSILPQDTGISTVIFDIGDVLVSANIKDYLMADPEIPNDIIDELLKLWFIDKDEVDDTMDLGTYREIVNKRMGVEFSKYIPKLFKYNVECVTAFDYTIPMIQDLKDKGYKVYYLSNWSAWTYDLLQEAGKFDFLKFMDGGVFSYDAGYMKPDEEIYKILLNKYKINPEEALFFDDREENIEAANKLGIHGVHFPRHDSSIVYNNLYGRKLSKAISEYTYLSYPFNPSYNEKAVGNIVARVLEFELGTDPMSPDMSVSLQEFTKTGAQIGKAEIEDIRTIIDSLEDDSFDDFKFKDIVYCDIKYKAKKPIAFITIRVKNINNSTVGYVSLAVDPKYQNQGIGKSLTTKAVSWFKKEKGIDFLEWHCLQDNEASKKLASDAGFREYIAKNNDEYIRYTMESSIQEYGTTGGTIVGSNQPDSVYIVNYMQNNVFSGYKEPKRAICKKGMNQMYTTNSGKAIPVDIDKFKEEASDISVFRFKGTPVLSYDQIIENASTDNDFYLLLTGDTLEAYGTLEYDNRFIQEENFFDELSDITFCTESTITGQIESSNYPYMKILTESMDGRSWNFYRDINGVFAMNELTGLRTPSYENAEEIPKSQIKLIERGTVYFGD